MIKAPRSPTKAEREQHEVSHWPFQEWCKECVQGRGICSPHRCRDKIKQIHETPTIVMDYCFPEGRPKKNEGEEPKKTFTVLALTEQISGNTYCSIVPKKGTSYGIVAKIVNWIEEMGHEKIIVKCDNEPSILQV